METQNQDTSLYIGTFQNTKEVIINGGHFAVNNHNTIKRDSDTDLNIKRLFEHISTTALHNSRERAQEVPETELKNIVHEWSLRLQTLPTTISTPSESSPPLSSPFDRLSTGDALSNIFKWLYDPFTSYSVVWMHENTRTQALLLANALAHVLQRHGLLSASYFFTAASDSASVVPTIAYQLAQNITQAAVPIAQAVGQNLAVFTSRCHDQVEQLILHPLRNASDLCNEFSEAPTHKVIIIHGLEDYNDKDNFQASFLDSLTRAVVLLETTHLPQKLLVLGQYTDLLQRCFSNLASQRKIVQRPIQLHNLLEKEHEICRKEKEIEKRDKALADKEKSVNTRVEALRRELRSQEARLDLMEENVKQAREELEKNEGALRCREEEICGREKEVEKREGRLRCREEEICGKEKEIEKRDKAFRSQEAHRNQMEEQRGKGLQKREGALRCREEKVGLHEQQLKNRLEEMEDTTRRREEALGLREQALAEREGASSFASQSAEVEVKEVLEPILGEALLHQREVEDLGLKLNQTRAGQTQPEELVGAHEEKSNRIWSELKDPSLPSGTSAECNDVKGYTSLPCAMFTRDRAGPQSPLVSRLSRNSVVDSEQLSQEDVTIVVMGPTGSGKSTFIETVTGIRGIVGHASESCTHKIAVFKITFPELGSDIHFVDTPGFDDTTRSDVDIFKMISDWLHNTYRKRIQVTGLLYFHRISDNRMAGTALKNLRLFESLCGEEFNKIVLTTTMWDEVDEKTGRYRENDLKNSYWEAMVERGSTIRRFLLTRPSAFEVLEPILREVSKRKALLLQREVEDLGLKLNETRARQTLSLHLEELVGAHEEKLNRIRNELKDPSITPTQLRLLMEDCQTITRQIQETMDNAKRIKTLTTSKSPKKLRHFIDTVFRPKIPRPTSRQEKAPAPPRVQDRETRLPQSTLEEEMVLPRRNPTTSGSSRHDRPRSPGEGASSSSRGPSNLYRPPQRWDTMTGSSSNQPEYTSSSSLSSGGLLRSTGLRSVPNQPFHSWQSTPPPRSHTVRPDGRRASLTSPSRRASTPPTDGTMGSHQGVPSAQDQPLMTPLRRSRSQPQDAPPPIPRLPWL